MSHRVKVYRLNERGSWDDGGTGHVQLVLDDVRFVFFVLLLVLGISCGLMVLWSCRVCSKLLF